MFTVVICDEHIIQDCYHKYHNYFKPFFDDDSFAFLKWNVNAGSLDEALPGLREVIRHKKEWRALIVNDSSTWSIDAVNKRNPFDYVDAKKKCWGASDFGQIAALRRQDEAEAEKALTNPLMRLSVWLGGSPVSSEPLVCYASEADSFETAEDKAYFEMLEKMKLSSAEAECDRSRKMRYDKLKSEFELHGELFNSPVEMIAVSERAGDSEIEMAEIAWKVHTEFDYSKFYIDNLYSEKLRYLLFDVPYIKNQRNESQYFNFLVCVLLLASFECPRGALREGRVYTVGLSVDAVRIRELCGNYISRLAATADKIDSLSRRLSDDESRPIDPETAQECFESDITIPIEVVTDESRNELMAEYSSIGLSGDCPQDEYKYWDGQYHGIYKYFIRFLREPRRAVKTTVKGDFRRLNRIDDDRVSRLSEYQREDVMYRLVEEESAMVTTTTTKLYNTAQYNEKLREADKDIRRGIAQRMTKKKTLIVSAVAIAAYLFGFIPLIVSGFNDTRSLLFAFAVTGAALGIFAVIGFIYLLVMRRRLVNRFKHFNYVMSGILNEIENGVAAFSRYLSHACNVMREFSVLESSVSAYRKKQNVLMNHKRVIRERIAAAGDLFAPYIDSDNLTVDRDADPYNYDFTVAKDYDYDMTFSEVSRNIDFLQTGNRITVPVDYIESVTMTREELYD